MKIQSKQFFCIIFYLLYIILCSFFILTFNDFKMLSIFILINLLFQIAILKYLKIAILSLAPVFILLGQLFQFGSVLLYSFNYDFKPGFEYQFSRLNGQSLYAATSYALICVMAVFLGFLIYYKSLNSEMFFKNSYDYNAVFYKTLGTVFFIVFGGFWIMFQINNFYLSSSDYGLVYNETNSTIITLGLFMFVGLFFLMIAFKKEKKYKKSMSVLGLSIVLAIVSMLTGVRSLGMSIIVLMIMLYNVCIKKIKYKAILQVCIGGYFLLSLLTAIMYMRKSGFELNLLFSEWWNAITSNVVLNAVEEFGSTIFVLTHEFMLYDLDVFSHEPINIFLHELVVGLPFMHEVIPELVNPGIVNLNLFELGTSYIADFYYYLGYAGILFSVFWGMYLASIDNKLRILIIENDYYMIGSRFVFYLVILSEIRSSFALGYKVFILSIIMCWIIKKTVLIFYPFPKKA